MIRFDSVSKRYRGAQRPALDGISLEIGAGEFVFLVGASGSGKSSLLRLMLREEKPSAGEIHVLGQRLTSISTRKVPYFRRSLGVVFQDFRLLPNKTVAQNVAFTLQVIGKSRGFIQTTVPDVLETVGLAEKADNFPNELSGGEQQRVAIARAVVNRPAILLADEPTGNLDPRTSEGIMQVLERINAQGTTVVMATHDVTLVDKAQKRVVELVQGHIIRDELEATYVTSSLKLPKREKPAGPATGSTPMWARPSRPAAAVEEAPAPARPRTGPVPTAAPATNEIWVRTDTGPVLVPGEHAPWRAAPLAPPEPADDAQGRNLFFAAPVPAQRRETGLPTGQSPVVGAPAPAAETTAPVARPQRGGMRASVENTGDEQADDGFAGRHRGDLPDHLDFVRRLGLAQRHDDEVGPSS
ncbi:cell division ATP-binding protein FtsE [Amnibacterium endophyticum]|uniref:Cell division ATP-binding protein FtsE n=1 Tax=Amnibacterium endophyticum TaxID=2109337 RepID=A0ABW4LDY3_9MICO